MARSALLALPILLLLPPLVTAGQADARHGAVSAGADADAQPAGPKVVEEGVWHARLRSGLAYSTASVDDHTGLGGGVIERTQDLRMTLVYTPYPLVDVGGEVLWGRRGNQDGSHGDAWRLQFAVIYRLN